jgi:hypothetical protein
MAVPRAADSLKSEGIGLNNILNESEIGVSTTVTGSCYKVIPILALDSAVDKLIVKTSGSLRGIINQFGSKAGLVTTVTEAQTGSATICSMFIVNLTYHSVMPGLTTA